MATRPPEWSGPDEGQPMPVPRSVPDAQNALLDLRRQARDELKGYVIGYEQPLDLLLVAAVAGGHVLLEGPPGVAKTLMASAVARVLGV
jgi:MoxR-like ATPase